MYHHAPGGVAMPRYHGRKLDGDALIAQLLASRPGPLGLASGEVTNESAGDRALARALVDRDDRLRRQVRLASLGSPTPEAWGLQAGMPQDGAGAYGSIAETMRAGAGFDRRHGLSTQPHAGSTVQIAGRGRPRRRPFRSIAEQVRWDHIDRLKREILKLDPKMTFVETRGGPRGLGTIRSLEATLRRLKQELAQQEATEEERARAQEKFTEPDIRFRHYTNDEGLDGIERDKKIRARDRNRVHGENARKKPLSPADAEDKYEIKDGRGKNFVETDVEASRVENYKNPKTKWRELRVKGDLKLRNPNFRRRGKGHPQ